MKKIGLLSSLLVCSLLLTGCFVKVNTINDDPKVTDEYANKYLTAFGTEPFWSLEISGGVANFSSPMYDTDVSVPVNIRREGENYYFTGEELEGEFTKKDCVDGGKGDLHYYTVGVAKIRDYYYEGCGDDEKGIKMTDEEYEDQRRDFLANFSGHIKSCEQQIGDQLDSNATSISYVWYNRMNIGNSYKTEGYVSYSIDDNYYSKDIICIFQPSDFSDRGESGNGEIEYWGMGNITTKDEEEQKCIDSLIGYLPEGMPGDTETMVTAECYPEDYYGPGFISGYVYTTTYSDLGIRVSTPAGWNLLDNDSIFNHKSDEPIFIRSGNRISYFNPRNGEETEYIQIYDKPKNEGLEFIIRRELLNPKCSIYEANYYNQNKIFTPDPGTIIYGISNGGDSLKECIIDNDINDDAMLGDMIRFFESTDKTKYYKMVFGDGCAPGPCSVFGKVELF